MRFIFIYLIRAYQLIVSPVLPENTCRFYPSCSEYSLQSYKIFGVGKGTWMTIRRVVKCHPFHPGGFDPVVPEEGEE